MKTVPEQEHINVCGIWFGECSRSIRRVERQLQSIIHHIRDCGSNHRLVIYRLIVDRDPDEWRGRLDRSIGEAITPDDRNGFELQVLDLSDFLAECETILRQLNGRVIPDLSRVINFYLAHPIIHPNYAAASDIVRLLCLARWGGLYLDVDNRFDGPCPSSGSPPRDCCLIKSAGMTERQLAYGTHEMTVRQMLAWLDGAPPAFSSLRDEARRAATYLIESPLIKKTFGKGAGETSIEVPVNGLICLSSTRKTARPHPVGLLLVEEVHKSITDYFREELNTSVIYRPREDNRSQERLQGPKLSAVICAAGQFYSTAYMHGPVFFWRALKKIVASAPRQATGKTTGPLLEAIDTQELLTYRFINLVDDNNYDMAPGNRLFRPGCSIGDTVFISAPYRKLNYKWINYNDYPVAEDYFNLTTLMQDITGLQVFDSEDDLRRFSARMEKLVATYNSPRPPVAEKAK